MLPGLDISCLRSLVPAIRKHKIPVAVLPCDFSIMKFYAFKVIMLFLRSIPGIVHQWRHTDNFYVFQQEVEVFDLLTCIIDVVPLKFCWFKGLAGSNGFVEIRRRGIKFFLYEDSWMLSRAGNFSCCSINGQALCEKPFISMLPSRSSTSTEPLMAAPPSSFSHK